MRINTVRELHISMILQRDVELGHSSEHVSRILQVCRDMFRIALANRIISSNPCEYVTLPERNSPVGRREATTLKRNLLYGHLIWLDMIMLCGLRSGETARIRFCDIDDRYMFVDGTKNKNTKRDIPLPKELRNRILSIPYTFDKEYVC